MISPNNFRVRVAPTEFSTLRQVPAEAVAYVQGAPPLTPPVWHWRAAQENAQAQAQHAAGPRYIGLGCPF